MKQQHIIRKVLVAALLATVCMPMVNAQQTRQQRLRQHLYYLASDSLEGRLAGSVGGAKARQYILNQYKEIGLQPYSGNGIYPFRPSQQISSQMLGKDSLNNIIMIIPGSDPQLKNEYIVLGAHYDHVGIKGGKVYNGADDNASGSTALIEIARELYAHRSELKRSVIIAAFDGEEEGLFGSKEMVKMLGKDIDKVKVMLSIDMVGWLSANDALIIEGSSTLKGGKETLQQLGEEQGMRLKLKTFERSVMTATDTEPFAKQGQRPTLAVTTGLKSPYHKPEDDADLIDYEGMDRICAYVSELTLRWATDRAPLEPSGKVAPKHSNHLRPFEIGPAIGLGSAGFRYPGSAFYGKNSIEGHAGIDCRLNHNLWTLQGEALFNAAVMPKPDFDGTLADAFDDFSRETQMGLFVPVTLIYNFTTKGDFYFGAGANYRLLLNHTAEYHNNLWGVHCVIGFRIGQLGLSLKVLRQLTPYYIDGTKPKTTSLQSWFTISYLL